MKLTDNYRMSDIPANRKFTLVNCEVFKQPDGKFNITGYPLDVMIAAFFTDTTDADTGVPRDIKALDASTVMASMGHVFLIKAAADEYYIEEFDETGTVHFARYFTTAPEAGRQFAKQTLGMLSAII